MFSVFEAREGSFLSSCTFDYQWFDKEGVQYMEEEKTRKLVDKGEKNQNVLSVYLRDFFFFRFEEGNL